MRLHKPPHAVESRRPHTFWFTPMEWATLCETAQRLRDEPSKLGRQATLLGLRVLTALIDNEAPVEMLKQG